MSNDTDPNTEVEKALADLNGFKPTLAAMKIERSANLRGTLLLEVLHRMPPERKKDVTSSLSDQTLASSLSALSSAREAAVHLSSLPDHSRRMNIINTFADDHFALAVSDQLSALKIHEEPPHSIPTTAPSSSDLANRSSPSNISTTPGNPSLDSKAEVKHANPYFSKSSTSDGFTANPDLPTALSNPAPDPISPKTAGNASVTPVRPTPISQLRPHPSTWTPPSNIGLPHQQRPRITSGDAFTKPRTLATATAVTSGSPAPRFDHPLQHATAGSKPMPDWPKSPSPTAGHPQKVSSFPQFQPHPSGNNTASRSRLSPSPATQPRSQHIEAKSPPPPGIVKPDGRPTGIEYEAHERGTKNRRPVIKLKTETKYSPDTNLPPSGTEVDPPTPSESMTPLETVKLADVTLSDDVAPSGLDEEEYDDELDNGDPDVMGFGQWDWKTNDAKAKEWGLDQEVEQLPDPLYTAPALTRWMYRLRRDVDGIESYQRNRKEEFEDFKKIPKEERRHAGSIWHRSARFDWHFRVWMAVWAHSYSTADESTKKTIISQMWEELVQRFPDADPNNSIRNVAASDGRELTRKYRRRINSWVYTVARSMRNTRDARKNGSTGLMLVPRRVPGLWKALKGKQRATTGFIAWGNTDEGKEVVNKALNRELDELGLAEGSQERNRQALGLRQKILSEKFGKLSAQERAAWTEKAKTAGKPRNEAEEKVIVDNTVEMAVDIFNRVTDETGMRIVLLAAGRGEHGVPIVVREFGRSFKNGQFLATSLGQRIKHHWVDFATEMFSADPSELIEIEAQEHYAEGEEEGEEDGLDTEAGPSSSKQTRVRTIFQVSPFLPPADCNTRSKRDQFLGKWAINLICRLSGARITWKQVSQNPDKYVDPQRMPIDPEDHRKERRYKFEEPSRMTNPASKAFWKHIADSANGALPKPETFTLKAFDAHSLIPKVVVPKTGIHQASINASRTKPVKGKGKAPIAGSKRKEKVRTGKKRKVDEEDEEEDLSEMLDRLGDAEDWSDLSGDDVDDSVAVRSRSRRRKSSGTQSLTRQEEDFELGDVLGGYHSDSDNSIKDPNWGPSPKPEVRKPKRLDNESSVSHPARSLSPPPAPLTPPSDADTDDNNGNDDFALQTNHDSLDSATPPKTHVHTFGLDWGIDRLFHPEILKVTPEQTEGFEAHWNSFKKYGANAQFVGEKQRSLPLSTAASARISFPFPSAVSSAMCISHIWHVFQAQNVTKPRQTLTLSDAGPLSAISSEHHIRLVVTDILDVDCALPSVKLIESTTGMSPMAINTLLVHFENLLIDYNDRIISSPELILHGDLSLPQALRVATIVQSSGFIRDRGKFGHHCAQVRDISDRFTQTLGAIGLVRYFEEVIGRSIDLWWRENKNNPELQALWLRSEGLWKKGVRSLVGAITAGQVDLFEITLFGSSGSSSLQKTVESILTQPAWWTPANKTLPEIQAIKGKLSIPNANTCQLLQSMNWQKATLMDRAIAMLIVFAGGVQLSTGRGFLGDENELVQPGLWVDFVCKMTTSITDHDAEIGPVGPTSIDRSLFIAEVNDWIALWEQETLGGRGTRLYQEIKDSAVEKAFKATQPPTPPPRMWRDESGAFVISLLPLTQPEAGPKKRRLSTPPSPSVDLPVESPLLLGALKAESTSVPDHSPTGSPNLTTKPPHTPHPANTAPVQKQEASPEPTEVVVPAAKRRRGKKGPDQPGVEIDQTKSGKEGGPATESSVGLGPRMTRQQQRRQAQESTMPPEQAPEASAPKVPAKRKDFDGADGPGAPGRQGRSKKVRITEEMPEPEPESQQEPQDVDTEATEKDRSVKKKGGKGAGGGRAKAKKVTKGGSRKGAAAGVPAVKGSGKRKK